MIAVWAFFAFYQSIVFYYFTAAASQHGHGSSGKILGQWDVSTMAFTCVVVTVNLRLLMSCNSITRWHYFSVAGSIAAWFLFIFIYSAIMTSFDRQVGELSSIVWLMTILLTYALTSCCVSSVGKCIFCDLCPDEYLFLLPHTNACSYHRSLWRLPISIVRYQLFLAKLYYS